MTHGLSAFVAVLAFFLALAVAGWIFLSYGAAVIVLVAAGIFVAIALPPLVMYYDEGAGTRRYPDALH